MWTRLSKVRPKVNFILRAAHFCICAQNITHFSTIRNFSWQASSFLESVLISLVSVPVTFNISLHVQLNKYYLWVQQSVYIFKHFHKPMWKLHSCNKHTICIIVAHEVCLCVGMCACSLNYEHVNLSTLHSIFLLIHGSPSVLSSFIIYIYHVRRGLPLDLVAHACRLLF